MALNMGSAVAFLELDTSKFKSGFKSAISDLKVFQASGATTEQKLKGLSSAFSTVGGGLTKGLTLPLVGVGAASVGVARINRYIMECKFCRNLYNCGSL